MQRPSHRLQLAGLLSLPLIAFFIWSGIRLSAVAEQQNLVRSIVDFQKLRPKRTPHVDLPTPGNFSDEWARLVAQTERVAIEVSKEDLPDFLAEKRGEKPLSPREKLPKEIQANLALSESVLLVSHTQEGPSRPFSDVEFLPFSGVTGNYSWLIREALEHDSLARALDICLDAQALARDLRLTGGLVAAMVAGALSSNISEECESVLAKATSEERRGFLKRLSRIEYDLADIKWVLRGEIHTLELMTFGGFLNEKYLQALPLWAQDQVASTQNDDEELSSALFRRFEWRGFSDILESRMEQMLEKPNITEEELIGGSNFFADISMPNYSKFQIRDQEHLTRIEVLYAILEVSLSNASSTKRVDRRTGLPLVVRREKGTLIVETAPVEANPLKSRSDDGKSRSFSMRFPGSPGVEPERVD